jgi:hypothetical protein
MLSGFSTKAGAASVDEGISFFAFGELKVCGLLNSVTINVAKLIYNIFTTCIHG